MDNEKPQTPTPSLTDLMGAMAAAQAAQEPFFLGRLRGHFGADPRTLPVVAEEFPASDHPNFQLAIDTHLRDGGFTSELLGVSGGDMFRGVSLPDLLSPPPAMPGIGGPPPSQGPVQYRNVHLDAERLIACVVGGLYLFARGGDRFALLVRGPSDAGFRRSQLAVELMAGDNERAQRLLAELRVLMRRLNVYRSRVVTLSETTDGFSAATKIELQSLPRIERDALILPAALLARLERSTIGFSRHREILLSSGRHLKRGLLLYGPPGTGKTLTAMYLAGQMRERTTLLVTGLGVKLLKEACAMARSLQPSLVVLEDVDIIAQDRESADTSCRSPLLFDLLNQMDGLAEDTDVIFVLTTNRPQALEPALAARPGRIDLAVEIPLPDADCRRQLLALYGRGLSLEGDDLAPLIARTEGVSAAFIRELLRRAALFAADAGRGTAVDEEHLKEALHELLVDGGPLTRSLLGAHAHRPT
ncbi:AAA family ATPase [Sorangium sp. So ce426]|uniref:AAA family ATPase n=1 Tax=unclassified Sorangium TaxID=2621164 RepID=UPI003F5B0192